MSAADGSQSMLVRVVASAYPIADVVIFDLELVPGFPDFGELRRLVDNGRRLLEQKVGYTPPPTEKFHRWTQRHPNSLYFGGISLFTVIITDAYIMAVSAGWITDLRIFN
mgnify:CR=1 FL=1